MQIVVSAIPVFIFNQVEQIKEVTGGELRLMGCPQRPVIPMRAWHR